MAGNKQDFRGGYKGSIEAVEWYQLKLSERSAIDRAIRRGKAVTPELALLAVWRARRAIRFRKYELFLQVVGVALCLAFVRNYRGMMFFVIITGLALIPLHMRSRKMVHRAYALNAAQLSDRPD